MDHKRNSQQNKHHGAHRPRRRRRRLNPLFLITVVVLLLGLLLGMCMCQGSNQEDPLPVSTQESTENQTQPVVEVSRGTLCVMGDIMAHTPIISAAHRGGEHYRFDSNFDYIKSYIQSADFAVANLETTLAGSENGYAYSGFPNFNCPDGIVAALKNAGFDLLLTANNHSNDTGAAGMKRTVQVIQDAGLLALGTKEPAANAYTLQTVGGISMGMVNYTYGRIDAETGIKSVNQWPVDPALNDCINVFDTRDPNGFYREMEAHITAMKNLGADMVILFIHWGDEYQLTPSTQQKEMAQKLCDLGVDVIVGSHPHVVQPMELLSARDDPDRKTICIYSLGNALSNQRADKMDLATGHTEDGLLVKLTFVKYSDGSVYLEELEALPTWVYIRYGEQYRSYDILPLDPSVSDWKSALNIGNTNLEYAKDSYHRTMEQLGPGLDTVRQYLEENRQKR